MRFVGLFALLLVVAACGDDDADTTNASNDEIDPRLLTPFPTQPVPQESQAAIGETVELDHGITITIHEVMDPVEEPERSDPAERDYIAIDVELCAGPELPFGAVDASAFDFSSRMPDNTRSSVDLGEHQPSFYQSDLTANECNRGWVSYSYDPGQRPALLIYDMTYGETTYNVRWQYPQ